MRLTTTNNKTVPLATAYLPPEELAQIKRMIAEHVPGESVTIPRNKHAEQLGVAGLYWLARRKLTPGTAWVLGIAWLLLGGLLLVAMLLPDVPSQ